jgi:hypothetical protein
MNHCIFKSYCEFTEINNGQFGMFLSSKYVTKILHPLHETISSVLELYDEHRLSAGVWKYNYLITIINLRMLND